MNKEEQEALERMIDEAYPGLNVDEEISRMFRESEAFERRTQEEAEAIVRQSPELVTVKSEWTQENNLAIHATYRKPPTNPEVWKGLEKLAAAMPYSVYFYECQDDDSPDYPRFWDNEQWFDGWIAGNI